MAKFRAEWQALSFESKLAIIVAPLLIAIVAGVLVPLVNRLLTPTGPVPVLRATLSNVSVETGVTLDEVSERQTTTALLPESSASARGAHIAINGGVEVLVAARTIRMASETQSVSDRDGDGVPDARDKCPDKAASTANGCPLEANPDP